MNLRDYLDSRRGAGMEMAKALGFPPPLVYQWASQVRRVPAEHCPAIERHTRGAVRCEDLRSDVDWAYLRGTSPVNPENPQIPESREAA